MGKTFKFMLKGYPESKIDNADLCYVNNITDYDKLKSLFNNIKHVPILLFDDYYSKDKNGGMPPEGVQGVHKFVKEIEAFGKVVLPSSDAISVGGITHLCFVAMKKGTPGLPEEILRVPILVTPKDSRPREEIIDNIKANKKLIKDFDWIKTSKIHNETAIIVSGGSSTDFRLLKKRIKETNAKVFCVKHSYPKLLEAGIQPFACVILDPRPIDGTSTHGVVRKDLFKKIDKKTLFLVASMTDPSVTKYLLEKNVKIKGWQAYSDAIRNMEIKDKLVVDKDTGIDEGSTLITGGTCAAMRTLSIAHTLGFRNFELFGFDCSIDNVTEEMKQEKTDTESNRPKYMQVETNGFKFWTTGELLAMAQDCEKIFDNMEMDMGIVFHGENTLCSEVWKSSKRGKQKYYTELLKDAA